MVLGKLGANNTSIVLTGLRYSCPSSSTLLDCGMEMVCRVLLSISRVVTRLAQDIPSAGAIFSDEFPSTTSDTWRIKDEERRHISRSYRS